MVLIVGSCAWAQASGQVTGTVKDHSGAVVPGAKVIVAKIVAGSVTDDNGSFRFPTVEPGEHLLLVESQGFLPWSHEVVVVQGNEESYIAAELVVAPVKGEEIVISQRGLEPRTVERYSGVLEKMKEPGLCKVPHEPGLETYRFLWLRTWREPILVRVDRHPDGMARMTLKTARRNVDNDQIGALKTTKARKLGRQDAEYLRMILDEANFWQFPSQVHSGTITMDGASWTIEGTKDGVCHVVDRSTPVKGPFRRLSLAFLLDIARLKLLYRDVF
jgi:hypothetical protein